MSRSGDVCCRVRAFILEVMFLRITLPVVLASTVALVLAACTSSSTGGGASSSSSGGTSGAEGDGGTSGTSGTAPAGGALPATTFLFTVRGADRADVLTAWDLATNTRTVVTDLTGDGSQGWEIAGYSISEDRTKVAIASLYEGTREDIQTGYAARRIHVLNADGTSFQRITPTWTAKPAGRTSFVVEIRDPAFSKDGSEVFFNYGEYWYENTNLQGGSSIWAAPTSGAGLPTYLFDGSGCSMTDPSADPSSGKILVNHSVCTDNSKTGLWLHARDGSTPPVKLVGGGLVEPSLEHVSWAKDGSGFLFAGTTERSVNGSTRRIRGLFAYDDASKQVVDLVLPTDPDAVVMDGALAPDASAAVYCLRTGTGDAAASNLHLLDLSTNPPTDTALTNDGVSCQPRW